MPPEMHHRHAAAQAAPFSLGKRLASFRHALRGLAFLLRTQHNAWIHALCTLIVLGVSAACGLSRAEWCLIVGAIGFVWVAEAFNTALEALCDATVPEQNPFVGIAKDVAAAAVFLSACTAAVLGLIVLGPPIANWLTGS